MASKLTQKQLETRDFILTVFRKEAPATKVTLKKLMKVYKDVENKPVTEKYGERLISSFLSVYPFKNYNDYKDVMSILYGGSFYDSGMTYYGQFHSIITKKLFDSSSIKTDWIIEDIADSGSFGVINNIINFIFTREKESSIEFLNKIIDDIEGHQKAPIIYEAIVRFGMHRNIKGLDGIFSHIFSKDPELNTRTIEVMFKDVKDKGVKAIIGNYLYDKTGNEEYLPDDLKELFVF